MFFLSAVFIFLGFVQPFHSLPWTAALNNFLSTIAVIFFISNSFFDSRLSKIKFNKYYLFGFFALAFYALYYFFYYKTASISPFILSLSAAFFCFAMSGIKRIGLNYIFFVVLAAAFLTCAVALMSYFDWVYFPLVNTPASGVRWPGLLGQSNNTGTILVWGIISIGYFVQLLSARHAKKATGFALLIFAILLASVLGFMAVWVQSRTVALNFLLVLIVFFLARRHITRGARLVLLSSVFVYFAGLWLLPQLALQIAVVEGDGFGGRGLSSNLRLEIWTDLLGALWQRPWLGYGIGGTVHAFLAIEEPSVVYGTYFAHAHNIVLELLLWFGIPLGSVLVFIFGRSLWRIARHVNEKTILPALMLMTLLVHAMLELPLHYAYFLIPMAIIWGWLSGQLPEQYRSKPVFTVSARVFSGTALMVLVPALYVLAVTYLHHEQSLRQAKLEMAIKGWVAPAEPPPYPVLWELEALNDFVRVQDSDLFEPAQLQRFHEVVSVYPAKTMIQKAVAVFTHNGDTPRVTYWRHKGCLIYAGDFCEKVTDAGSG